MTGLNGSGDGPWGGPRDGPLALARTMADAVESLANLWEAAAQGASPRLSPHQLRALQTLERDPGLNLTALAGAMDIGPPTASRLCDRLEAAGLLERESHPRNRRVVRLRLTRQGRQALEEVAWRRSRRLAAVLGAMEPAGREALGRGLQGFLDAQDAGTGKREAGTGKEDGTGS
ncbi:MarR family transcriptional regulator [Streptomyces shenzhenensis]|uniref:MarR family winged helix-turn-helix transcriptional regulator n=1 Tax=Streptomyces TaxID=1883 RepID=UPI001F3EE58A|nr:MarR family transcriptional regulator [Streptomyces shenzhenensis]